MASPTSSFYEKTWTDIDYTVPFALFTEHHTLHWWLTVWQDTYSSLLHCENTFLDEQSNSFFADHSPCAEAAYDLREALRLSCTHCPRRAPTAAHALSIHRLYNWLGYFKAKLSLQASENDWDHETVSLMVVTNVVELKVLDLVRVLHQCERVRAESVRIVVPDSRATTMASPTATTPSLLSPTCFSETSNEPEEWSPVDSMPVTPVLEHYGPLPPTITIVSPDSGPQGPLAVAVAGGEDLAATEPKGLGKMFKSFRSALRPSSLRRTQAAVLAMPN